MLYANGAPDDMTSTPGESLFARTRRLLREYGLRARKGLGQHFLVDDRALQRIIAAAALTPDDTVIEVGPGLGVLTNELARRAGKVVAVELDSRLAGLLRESLATFPNVIIVTEDILRVDPARLLRPEGGAETPPSYKVVANLPYYITSAVLRHFLESSLPPQLMLVMVQREVAAQIVAKPGDMSLLSISIQVYGKPEIVAKVPARSFYPPPNVDSALLRVTVYPHPAVDFGADREGFFRLVRAGFSTPRKQLVNSLANGLDLPKTEILPLLEKAGILPQRRAETLTLEEWGRLYHASREEGGTG